LADELSLDCGDLSRCCPLPGGGRVAQMLVTAVFAGWEHGGHIALKASEHSRLAANAVDVL